MKKFIANFHGEPDGGRYLRIGDGVTRRTLYDLCADNIKKFIIPDNIPSNEDVELVVMTLDEYIDLSKRVCGESD